ncbi:DUF2959 domain-containing protein [Parvularcula dongshanensis]|uniref:Skp family chaperone for outer membrane proteins n=1 Tax=Parvularcula dongshanensis TaxID=1173995 RepID=A0A840I3J2_9PROT|nr:DUF2959 domain-containing protein [Parvularcula dongshanensis]MBB4659347.1 Skp family chaperone for outer membrane proteins [Parvularcula dongshanensis]
MRRSLRAALAALVLLPATVGCSSVYYDTMEKFGFEKRDILVDRVEDGREAQTDAQEEFKDALTQFRELVAFDGGELEKQYDKVSRSYDRMQREAEEVRGRIDAIEDVGEALFDEWEDELGEYQSAELRNASARQLRETQTQYAQVVRAMNRAADKMDPVLEIYQDQVLYLKHSLNARAIAGLEDERAVIEQRVNELIAEMDAAIAEANRFIDAMQA